jgi:predicted metal-dependent hydrolase
MTVARLPPYSVRRSARARRARLTLSDSGDALVVLPMRAPESLAAELVARHGAWLERHRGRILAVRSALAERPALGAGRAVSLRGVAHAVVVERSSARARPSVGVVAGPAPAIVVRIGFDPEMSVAAVLERWLRAEARRDIGERVARRAAELGVSPASISVRDQRTRWGSASGSGALSFSWRLVLCPPAVLDYVVVHELAHLRWRGHGPRFWALVRRHVPDADTHRRWLRAEHRALHAALDERAA